MRSYLLPILLALIIACEGDAPSGETDGATGPTSTDTTSTGEVSGMASQTSESDDSSSTTSDSSTTGSGSSTGDAGSSSWSSTDSGETTTSSSSTGDATSQPAVCGDGQVDPGEECDDGNVDEMDDCRACKLPACADGVLDPAEECDDGNTDAGDGCAPACMFEQWEHFGVAHDVAVADLHGWAQCWSDDYSGLNKLKVSTLTDACNGAHLLMACRLVGSETLTLAAHAPREDVTFPVNYTADERHEANGVAWYWSPAQKYIGFAPSGDTAPCTDVGEDDQLCIKTTGAAQLDTFAFGNRCGAKLGFSLADQSLWERVVFQAD